MLSNPSLRPVARAALLATLAAASTLSSTLFSAAWAADEATVRELRSQIEAMRQEYEARLKALEARLVQAQVTAPAAAPSASAPAAASQTSAAPATSPATSTTTPLAKDNRFNPAVSVILSGTYTNLSKDPETWQIPGFVPAGDELGPGARGFSLAESELNLSANIDSWLFGSLTLAVTPEDTIETEEAFLQTTALPGGLTLKAGRFFSALGYLNEQHAHTLDFVDAPLAHQAFLGGQYKQEGLQAKWLLPTEQFIELAAELGNGASFPGSDRGSNGMGAIALAAHTGGDVGDSHNWRAGVSWLQAKAKERTWEPEDGLSNAFTGKSRMWVIDGVWKWAPQGNARRTNLKLQGEYFRRTETGELTHDLGGGAENMDAYRSAQSGWYLQGTYQFAPGWRVGLRHDRLDTGTVDLGTNAGLVSTSDHSPTRHSVMLDWGPSEFQRWRVQLSQDRVREGMKDTQFFLQYQVNLGAHGAHRY